MVIENAETIPELLEEVQQEEELYKWRGEEFTVGTEEHNTRCKAKADAYRQIADTLENILEERNNE